MACSHAVRDINLYQRKLSGVPYPGAMDNYLESLNHQRAISSPRFVDYILPYEAHDCELYWETAQQDVLGCRATEAGYESRPSSATSKWTCSRFKGRRSAHINAKWFHHVCLNPPTDSTGRDRILAATCKFDNNSNSTRLLTRRNPERICMLITRTAWHAVG
jgi:hypothetical protein